MHVLKFFLNTLLLVVVVAGGVFGFVYRKELAHEATVLAAKVMDRLQEVSGTQYATKGPAPAPKPEAAKPAPAVPPAPVLVASPPPPAPSEAAPPAAASYPPDDYSPQPPPAPAKQAADAPAAPAPEPQAPAPQAASEQPEPVPYAEQPLPPPGYPSMPYQGYPPPMAYGDQGAPPQPEETLVPPPSAPMPPWMAANENDAQQQQQQQAAVPQDPRQDEDRTSRAAPPRPARSEMSGETRATWIEARRAFWDQDIAKTEAAYLKLIKDNPDEADLPGELGNVYLAQGRVDDAADQYLEAGRRLLKASNRGRARLLVNDISRLDHAKAEQLRQEIQAQQSQRRSQGGRAY